MTSRPFLLRLLFPFTLMILLVITISGAVVYLTSERSAYGQQLVSLERVVAQVHEWTYGQATTRPGGGAIDAQTVERLKDLANVIGSRLTLIDGSGVVRFDSEANVATMENHNDRPEVRQARLDGLGMSTRHSATLDRDAVYLAQRLEPSESGGWIVRLSYPHAFWADASKSAWIIVSVSAIAALVLVWVMARLLNRRWIAPTRVLADAVERMADGRWDLRVPPAGDDELQAFSIKLNSLAAHAQRQLGDLRTQRGDLQVLVDTLPDSIITTDADERIVLINRPASNLLGLSPEKARGAKLVAAVSDQAILDLFDEGGRAGSSDSNRASADPVQRTVKLTRNGGRLTFQAFATPTAGGGVLLVLRDVSQLAANVQMKTDFVANASHELRTPIAAIKIAFETLREVYSEDATQADRCVRIIDGHLKRLEEMLTDLLDLSRVESTDLLPQVHLVKTNEVFAGVAAALGPFARQKLVELKLDDATPDQIPVDFYTDERLLNLILKNLVENSIKFTPAGGSVTVGFKSVDGAVQLSVADTGIGIPPEHVDRVFERFYQVDPARSGSAGRGTGLGLAIVKHAVAGLDGTLSLQSTPGQGTTVTCAFPQPAVVSEPVQV